MTPMGGRQDDSQLRTCSVVYATRVSTTLRSVNKEKQARSTTATPSECCFSSRNSRGSESMWWASGDRCETTGTSPPLAAAMCAACTISSCALTMNALRTHAAAVKAGQKATVSHVYIHIHTHAYTTRRLWRTRPKRAAIASARTHHDSANCSAGDDTVTSDDTALVTRLVMPAAFSARRENNMVPRCRVNAQRWAEPRARGV